MPDIPVEDLPQDRYRPRRDHPTPKPPTWLMALLGLCLALVALWSLPQGRPAQAAKDPPGPTPAVTASPSPTPVRVLVFLGTWNLPNLKKPAVTCTCRIFKQFTTVHAEKHTTL